MNRQTGFTLIELMIVVAIIGILAAIAYPSYQSAMMDSRRVTAEGDLVFLANEMERFYTTNATYVGASLPYTESPKDGSPKFYDLSISSVTATSFTLEAVPKGAQAGDRCGTLSLDQTGTKGVTSGTVADCW